MPGSEDRHQRAADEARRDLERLREESELVGTSAMARAARKAVDHFAAADAPERDPAEVWGRRAGRGLAAIFVAFLIWWLVVTYVLA